jgi:protein SMG6
VPGYSVLVLDTNILLSSLSMVTSLVDSLRWTVVVPLPAIMELDGLGSNATALGEATKGAIEFIASHVRSHSDGLKVQTSRGNYLSSLSVHAEQIDFDDPDSWERSMDDLILKAAIWQDDHWVDRSALLKVEQSGERSKGAAKVVLLSLDRNRELSLLPLKFAFSNAFGFVSSPQGASTTSCLDAASERDLGALLATTT